MIFKKGLVSVILPCYNVEQYLTRAIESVLNQSYSNFELLVIIDGSPDNSKLIAEEYAKKDDRIKVYEKPNGGLSDARNYGLSRAEGEFVYFMDSDDWIETDLLMDNVKVLENEGLDFVVFGYIQDDEDATGKVTHSTVVVPKDRSYHKDNKDLKIDNTLLGLLGYAWNKVYRRQFLETFSLRFDKGISLVEDILFNAQVYTHSSQLRTVDKAYYHYLNRQTITLVKTFHQSSFELVKMKIQALDKFLISWNVESPDLVLSQSLMVGIRYCFNNLFAYKNQLTFLQKESLVRQILKDDKTVYLIKFYIPRSFKDRIFKFLISIRFSLGICLIMKISK
ncbi:glycosyltransferase family 2 protein [Sphingobacterium sp. UDSM-2020]|uniref:glycosyltransferase family 2 protein n=1 Tax=Sphingobacterium sp. UDSM-2020 TaxID=2795738 RepID=UPI001937DAC4|nr:glycosyltransferase family 2 protein [Sphingobacterium sp. UDSM-2020]QQD15378.1 glycosyltransferase family 2 protein [Sphingobacterium sp. UDSM-2020]